MIYSIEVGRWTGAFGFVWYADVFSSEEHHRIVNFNALTKHGARNKAAKYIRRMHRGGTLPAGTTIYAYDASTDELRELPNAGAKEPSAA
jgi:hypothetical protein